MKIVARKSCHRPQAIVSPRSALTTLIACGNAAGDSLPPFLIFKGKKALDTLRAGALPGTKIEMSDSGWSNANLFQKFIEEHFTPYVNARRKTGEHVLLIYDGHKSHVPIPVIRFAREHNIILFVLPAHTSHFLQPLDVGVFSPMKSHYNATCSRYLREHPGRVVTRYNLCGLIGEAYLRTMAGNLQAGFKGTGIFPFHPEEIDVDTICGPSSLVNAISQTQQEEETDAATPILSATQTFLAERRPSPPSAETSKKRKYKYQAAGVAITETNIFLKILRLHNEDDAETTPHEDQDHDCESRVASSPTPTTHPTTPHQNNNASNNASKVPGPSGFHQDKRDAQRRLVFEDDNDNDTDDADDEESEPCCVCKQKVPKQLRKSKTIFIVDWVQCDRCSHWVHLRYCCRWLRAPKSYTCPCCDDV